MSGGCEVVLIGPIVGDFFVLTANDVPICPRDKNIIRWCTHHFTNVDISLIDHLSRDHDARIWLVSSFIQTSQDEDEEEDKPEVVDVPL